MLSSLLCFLVRLISGLNIRWVGCAPSSKTRVYFANHTSHLDFVALWAGLPKSIRRKTRPIAAEDYWGKGTIRRYISKKIIHAVLISRSKITKKNNPIHQMLQALTNNESLILFPEGTRSFEGQIKNFQPGLYHLMQHRPDIEYIPVYLENLSRILPKGEFIIIPLLGSASFGAPLKIVANEQKEDFLKRAREAIEELKP